MSLNRPISKDVHSSIPKMGNSQINPAQLSNYRNNNNNYNNSNNGNNYYNSMLPQYPKYESNSQTESINHIHNNSSINNVDTFRN